MNKILILLQITIVQIIFIIFITFYQVPSVYYLFIKNIKTAARHTGLFSVV